MSRTTISSPPPESAGQRGFTLAALIVIMTIISIIVAFTVPQQWSMILRRERDKQTIFLMKQFARGIKAWQKKHNGTLPVSLQQLQDAREPRVLRGDGKWKMPITGREEDWIMVPAGAIMNPPGPGTGGMNPRFGPPGSMPGKNPGSKRPGDGKERGGKPSPGAPEQPQQGARMPSQLNPAASPKDYVGPFVAVRPNATGQSFIALNGSEDYSTWVYTIYDLDAEVQARKLALARQ